MWLVFWLQDDLFASREPAKSSHFKDIQKTGANKVDDNGSYVALCGHTRGQSCDQVLQLGVTVQVVVFEQVAPEGPDDGPSLL